MHDYKTLLRRAGAVLFWLAVWQAAAMAIGQEVFLVSPVQALRCLLRLLPQADFWHRVGFSAGRMVEAFSEKCVKDVTTVTAECAGVEFTVKGSVVKQTGWRAVYGEEKEEITIPGWQEGDTLTPKGSSITEGKTKPKPLHTWQGRVRGIQKEFLQIRRIRG